MSQLDIFVIRRFTVGDKNTALRLLILVQAESPADVKHFLFIRQHNQVVSAARRIILIQVVFEEADQVHAVLDFDIGAGLLKERIPGIPFGFPVHRLPDRADPVIIGINIQMGVEEAGGIPPGNLSAVQVGGKAVPPDGKGLSVRLDRAENEIGFDQADAVYNLMKKDFKDIKVIKDLCGNNRVVAGYLN